jgi:hypothetical protein
MQRETLFQGSRQQRRPSPFMYHQLRVKSRARRWNITLAAELQGSFRSDTLLPDR